MGLGSAVREVVEQGTGGAAGIVRSQLFEHRALKSLHQFPVRFLLFQPVQSQPKKAVQGIEVGIRFGGLFNGLGEIRGSENPGVGLAQA